MTKGKAQSGQAIAAEALGRPLRRVISAALYLSPSDGARLTTSNARWVYRLDCGHVVHTAYVETTRNGAVVLPEAVYACFDCKVEAKLVIT